MSSPICTSARHCHPQRTSRGVWIAVVNKRPAVIKPTPVYITLRDTSISPVTGHELPPVRKPSHEKQNRITLCTSISDQVPSSPAVLGPIHTYHAVPLPRPCQSQILIYTYHAVPCRNPAVALRGRFHNGIFVA
jgi:hypothetical protein